MGQLGFRRLGWRIWVRATLVTLLAAALAGAVAWRLPEWRRPVPAASAPAVPWGVPERPIRVLTYNVFHTYRGLERVAGQINGVTPPPDLVMLQELDAELVSAMERQLNLPHRAGLLHDPQAGAREHWPAVYLLSRHPLYDVKAIRTPDRGVFGIWAVTVIDGKRFAVAAVHLSATMKVDPKHAIETERVRFGQIGCLMDFWRAQGSPPLIVAGDFNQLPFGPNYARMTADFTDGLASVGATDNTFASGLLRTRIDYVLHTPGWRATAGRVIDSDASDHRPVWLDLGPAR